MPLPSFRLPGSHTAKQRRPFTRSKQLRHWIENLPMANNLAAANQLLLQLRAINHADYSAKERFQWYHFWTNIILTFLELPHNKK